MIAVSLDDQISLENAEFVGESKREVFYLMFSLSFFMHQYLADAVSISEIKTSMDRFACQIFCGLVWFKVVFLLNYWYKKKEWGDGKKRGGWKKFRVSFKMVKIVKYTWRQTFFCFRSETKIDCILVNRSKGGCEILPTKYNI